ncbi:MAG: ABC transporter ATP-binding protein [Desulfobacteraceae bacterium]|nr:ABC transporter ATP-binding protein [Desulfobacteraceae bacterium]
MDFIVCDNLVKRYGKGPSAVHAINGISFSVQSGEFVAVMGESGSGKSTLLSVMGAMNSPSQGQYRVDDIDVYGLSSEQQADFRREYLGFVFQSFHLVPYLTVLENVMLPLTTVKKTKAEKRSMGMEALAWVGMAEKSARLPNEISGGEMERAAIARAIVNQPPILLADEPTGNLDSRNSRVVMDLMQRLNQSGVTVIMVTHSATCAQFAQRILNVQDGRLADGQVEHKQRVLAPQAA